MDTPGVKLERRYAGMAWDKARDAFSQKARVAAWDNLEAQHERSKHLIAAGKLKIAYNHANYLISGDKGAGKTLGAALLAMLNYAQGMDVFSTASFLFGHRIEAMDIFTMADSLPENCVIFVDEAHSVADRYSENSARNRTLGSSIALLRKNGVRLILASVAEHAVAQSIKSEIDTLVYPATYNPRKGHQYPPWCYIYANLIGPQPFRGRREADHHGIKRFGGDVKVTRRVLPPMLLYEAAKVMDTWAKPDIAAGLLTSADDVRKRLRGQDTKNGPLVDSELEERFLRTDLLAALKTWVPETKKLHWKQIVSKVQAAGSDLEPDTIRELCLRLFGLDSRGQVDTTTLMRPYNVRRSESP